MKTFKNSKGIKIFELDYNGNLYISGDLTLSPESTITAGNIKALVDADVAVIRESIDMVTPYLGKADVVYYLGENTEEYTYGTWWEKYTIGYNCTIDVSYTKVPGFTVYEGNASFYVTDNDVYSYNKEVLDSYPTTNKIVVTAINSSDIAHWEIKYYNDSTLLYTDLIESAYFTATGYNFPFSPINSEDYPEGSTDIIINVQAEHALREINAIDWESFMPKTGGDFQGIISTKDITPLQADTYSIGTETGRYKNGYFSNVYTGYLKTNTLSIENLNLEKFTLSSTKTDLVPGDGIVITDGADNNSVKASSILKFSGDKTRYLRQDGTFAVPNTIIQEVTELSPELEIDGFTIIYKGYEESSLLYNESYIGSNSDVQYQLRFKGVTLNSKYNNTCIINKQHINTASKIIQNLNSLNLGNIITDFVEKEGSATIVYNKGVGWYIKKLGDSNIATIPGAATAYLLNDLVRYDTNYYEVISTSDNVEVTISKFIWQPINNINFNALNKNNYLSQAGTWEVLNKTPDVKIIQENIETLEDGTVYKIDFGESLNIFKSPNVVLIASEDSGGINGVCFSSAYKIVSGRNFNICYKQKLYIDNKIYTRSAVRQASGISTVTDWSQVYQNELSIKMYKPNYWFTISAEEWDYLLQNRTKGHKIVYIMSKPFLAIYADNINADDLPTYYSSLQQAMKDLDDGLVIFLPTTGKIDDEGFSGGNSLGTYHSSTYSSYASSCMVFDIDNINNTIHVDEVNAGTKSAVRLAHFTTEDESDYYFSIGQDRKVIFAKSNLQYNTKTGKYRFAPNFYDSVLENNFNLGGWIDLFVYGTGNDATASIMPSSFVDWGVNIILEVTSEDSEEFF